MFIIYVNDLSTVVENSSVLTFADDTKIVSKISNVEDKNKLQMDLNNIINWSNANNMVLNNNKFELVNYRLNKENENQRFFKMIFLLTKVILRTMPPMGQKFVHLQVSGTWGSFIDRQLNFDSQVNSIASKAKQTCACILSVFHTRDQQTMIFLFNSLVRPKVEYCDAMWKPCLKSI